MATTQEQKVNRLLRYFCDDEVAEAIASKLSADMVDSVCKQLSHEYARAEFALASRILNTRTQREGLDLAREIVAKGEPPEPEFRKAPAAVPPAQ